MPSVRCCLRRLWRRATVVSISAADVSIHLDDRPRSQPPTRVIRCSAITRRRRVTLSRRRGRRDAASSIHRTPPTIGSDDAPASCDCEFRNAASVEATVGRCREPRSGDSDRTTRSAGTYRATRRTCTRRVGRAGLHRCRRRACGSADRRRVGHAGPRDDTVSGRIARAHGIRRAPKSA